MSSNPPNQDVIAKIQALEVANKEIVNELECLNKQLQVEKVAFSASLRHDQGTLGPFPQHTLVVFSNVETNIGNAYNPTLGVFTAPVKGVYHFEFYVTGEGMNCLILVKNGEHIFSAAKHTPTFSTTANAVNLVLESGDCVSLKLFKDHTIYDNENRHTTFSGHLLFTL